jgi:FtsZ-interacting cell division protein YlmF
LDLQEIPDEFIEIAKYLQAPLADEDFRRQLEAEEEIDYNFDLLEAKYIAAKQSEEEALQREEKERKQKEEALQREEEERKQKEEERKQKEEERKQKEEERKQKEEAIMREKVAQNNLLAVAKELLKSGMTIKKVHIITKIPIEELNKLL